MDLEKEHYDSDRIINCPWFHWHTGMCDIMERDWVTAIAPNSVAVWSSPCLPGAIRTVSTNHSASVGVLVKIARAELAKVGWHLDDYGGQYMVHAEGEAEEVFGSIADMFCSVGNYSVAHTFYEDTIRDVIEQHSGLNRETMLEKISSRGLPFVDSYSHAFDDMVIRGLIGAGDDGLFMIRLSMTVAIGSNK